MLKAWFNALTTEQKTTEEGAVYGAPRDSSYINKRPGRAAPYLHRRIIDSPCLTPLVELV